MKQVIFASRTTAEVIGPFKNWAVISITDPGTKKVKFREGWHSVLSVQFHDQTEAIPPYVLLSADDAYRIFEFVMLQAPQIDTLLIHCKGGISRSAALAKFFATEFDIPFDHDYQSFNAHVFRMLNAAELRWRASHH